jgi:hypothetical protein
VLFLSFFLKSSFLLITNDGSPGDLLYKKIGNKKTPFYFWKNGYEKLKVNNTISKKKINHLSLMVMKFESLLVLILVIKNLIELNKT